MAIAHTEDFYPENRLRFLCCVISSALSALFNIPTHGSRSGGFLGRPISTVYEPVLRSCLQHLPFALSNIPGPSGTFLHKGALGPGDVCLIRTIAILCLSCAAAPLLAQNPAAEVPSTGPLVPVITDTEFNAAIPSLDDAPLESIDAWQTDQAVEYQRSQYRKILSSHPAVTNVSHRIDSRSKSTEARLEFFNWIISVLSGAGQCAFTARPWHFS
jgi:hypothetical protein